MHLKSITLHGFKSFPDKTRLDFTPGVSVVVGPNGSGKSNVTDAVLWALGEQSPSAVRGQSMQDVIFAGARGVPARSEAHVEVVLDNSDATVDLPASEISISRRIDRSGEGEYRINGARCRLTDVLEVLSDTGLGREMHSVVSQGRVEGIVTSKPRDRRLLIEEAAGLGKHRQRRRRAQVKLDRTQENLDRALDVEREARSRLRPLKRQAEAAELHARLERQLDETSWALAREAARAAVAAAREAERLAKSVGVSAADEERRRAAIAGRRAEAERALGLRAAEREARSARYFAARAAGERVELRLESAVSIVAGLRTRATRRGELIAALERDAAGDPIDAGSFERVAALESELAELARDREERRAHAVADLEASRIAAAEQVRQLSSELSALESLREQAESACGEARRARHEAGTAADRARRESARIGAELAAANHFLRLQAGAPGGARALSDALSVEAGYELAVAAVLGARLRAALVEDRRQAGALLDSAGRDGGTALLCAPAGAPPIQDAASTQAAAHSASPAAAASTGATAGAAGVSGSPPGAGARPLSAFVRVDGSAQALVAVLLADTWWVPDLDELDPAFTGIAVTSSGRMFSARTRELRQAPAGGEDRVLAERNRRDELVRATGAAAQAEHAARGELECRQADVSQAESGRETLDSAVRDARRAASEASEQERHWLARQQARERSDDDGLDASRRAQLQSALSTERRLAERAERDRSERARRIATEQRRRARETDLLPPAERLLVALEAARLAVAARVARAHGELQAERVAGDHLASELSACAAQESQVQAELERLRQQLTQAEVRAQHGRDQAAAARAELAALAARLGLADEPADTPLDPQARDDLAQRSERLRRRRAQLGPVNPLAEQEHAEALAHVEELERQREDLDAALRELKTLIRDTDRRIGEAFDETFQAAARNFAEVAEQLFPGGRGRLRLVREDSGIGPLPAGSDQAAAAVNTDADPEPTWTDEDPTLGAALGVEIEITPAGKATRRLSLLSGGEKSMTALAFLFAVFLARPCPFYILDEVEAALDDANIDRFLSLLRRVSDRAQFVVVTHQRRTMEAADCLYGVSMAGNGVSKVVSRASGAVV